MRAPNWTTWAWLSLAGVWAAVGCGGNGDEEPAVAATGELGDYRAESLLPEPSVNHCATVLDDYVIVAGGNHKPAASADFVRHDTVLAAQIGEDGVLGPWGEIGRTPSPVQSCALTTDGDRLFLVGGTFDNEADGGQVWAASFTDAGLAWASMGSLPTDDSALIMSDEAWIHGTTLVIDGTTLPQESDLSFTASADISGSSLGSWRVDNWLDAFRHQAQHAKVGSYVYYMGGYGNVNDQNLVYTEAHVAALDDDAAVIDSFQTTDIPAETAFGEAIAVDAFVFLVGGRAGIAGGGYANAVYVSESGPDGQLGAWSQVSTLPVAMSSFDVVAGREFLYIIGGSDGDAQLSSVHSARVRYPVP